MPIKLHSDTVQDKNGENRFKYVEVGLSWLGKIDVSYDGRFSY